MLLILIVWVFDLDFVAVLLLLRCLRLFGVCLGLFVVIYGLLRRLLLIYFVGCLVVFVGYVDVLFGLGVYFELLFDLWCLICLFNSVAYCGFCFCGELLVKVGGVLFYGCVSNFVVFDLGCACYLLFWICGILSMMLWK